MDRAIEVKNLSKRFKVYEKEPGLVGSLKSLFKREYREMTAVDNVSFGIKEGELIGFIGPNGAGKTTTLKMLSGLLYPSDGAIKILGYNPWERNPEMQKQFALVMGQKNQLWWDLPAIESFILNKEIYEVPDDKFEATLNELAELLEVKEILRIQVRKLSLGQRMKCELIAALIHSPKILFLDEPTIGLDVVMQKRMREFIKEYNRRYNATIILTSHYMDDVKELCKRVIIIDSGKVVFDGELEKIVKKYADHKLIGVVLDKKVSRSELEKFGDVKSYNFPNLTVSVKRDQASEVASKMLKKLSIVDLNIEEAKIEDIIREVFSGQDVA